MQRSLAGHKRRVNDADGNNEGLSEQELVYLTLVGYAAVKFPGDSLVAAAVARGVHLVPVVCAPSVELMIDRHDVRATLAAEDLASLSSARHPDESSDAALDYERYRDMREDSPPGFEAGSDFHMNDNGRGSGPEFQPPGSPFAVEEYDRALGAGHAASGRSGRRRLVDVDNGVSSTGANAVPLAVSRFHAEFNSSADTRDAHAGLSLATDTATAPAAAVDSVFECRTDTSVELGGTSDPVTTERAASTSRWFPRYAVLPLPQSIVEAADASSGPSVPSSAAEHAMIELTARRVAAQPQLEVMLRIKQAGAAEFAFLDPDHSLHSYYRHLLFRASSHYASNSPIDWPPPCDNSRLAVEMTKEEAPEGDPEVAVAAAHSPEANGNDLRSECTLCQNERVSTTGSVAGLPVVIESSIKPLVAYNPLGIGYDSGDDSEESDPSPSRDVIDSSHIAAQQTAAALAATAAAAVTRRIEAARAAAAAAAAALDAASRLAPPAPVIEVMDKLIAHAKRGGGRRLVDTVRDKERANAKFAFLLPWNTHHAFFERRLAEAFVNVDDSSFDDAGSDARVAGTSSERNHAAGVAPSDLSASQRQPISVSLSTAVRPLESASVAAAVGSGSIADATVAAIPPGPALHARTVRLRHPLAGPAPADPISARAVSVPASQQAARSRWGPPADLPAAAAAEAAPPPAHAAISILAAATATASDSHSCQDPGSAALPAALPAGPKKAPLVDKHPTGSVADGGREYITSFEIAPVRVTAATRGLSQWQPKRPSAVATGQGGGGYDSDDALDSDAGLQAWDSDAARAAFYGTHGGAAAAADAAGGSQE